MPRTIPPLAASLGVALLLALSACAHKSAEPVRHYPLSGKIVSLDRAHQTATIDAAAIPNFMEAMVMEYPIAAASDWQALKVGDRVTATIDVYADDQYKLSGIHVQGSPK